jgi:6-phosphogluconolactonase
MEKFFIGCYSDKKTSLANAKGKGISVVTLDCKLGTLREEKIIENVDNPSYLFLNKNRGELYSCSERFNQFGVISIIDLETLKVKDSVSSKGIGTCYICYDEKNNSLIWTNYQSGDIGSFNLVSRKEDYLKFNTHGVNKERLESSHPHFIEFFQDTILITDLGCDCIHVLNRTSDRLICVRDIKTPKGYGPRHMCISDNKMFVICELIPKLLVYKYEFKTENWLLEEELDNEEKALMDVAQPAAIKKGKNNIYTTSNRFSNGLRQFEFSCNEHINAINTLRLKGEGPRDLCFSKNGRFVLVPMQDSNWIEVYPVDIDGKICDEIASVFKTGTPVCVINY